MSTIKIFIYSTDTQHAELSFPLEKLTWDSLVLVITSTKLSIDSPLTLYYRLSGNVHLLENQTQFSTLLSTSPNELKLYFQQDDVKQDIFEQPPPYESAFSRLGKLLEAHKPIISSHKTLSRCMGILASAIAMDTNNRDFDKEFKALEKVIEAHRSNHDVDEEGLEHVFGYYCRGRGAGNGGSPARGDFGGSSRGFGRGFMFGGRGAYHHHQRREEHHPGRESSSTEEEQHRHRHGPPNFFDAISRNERGKKKAQACFRGQLSEEGSSDEMKDMKHKLKNTHIGKKHHHHHYHRRGGGGEESSA